MNSLTYLSRQFDALASAKTPPSTPTSESHSFHQRRNSLGPESPRLSSWNTKSFLFSPSSSATPPKRSYSSPAEFIALARRAAVSSPTPTHSAAPLETESHPKPYIQSFFKPWMSLMPSNRVATQRPLRALTVLTGEQISDNKLDVDPGTARSPSFPRFQSDPALSNVPTSLQPPTPPPPVLQAPEQPVPSSRSSTPNLTARKTPFHLPKTLVLDLDETLIHSTSRPIQSSGGGSGLFGLGSFGRRNKGAGHVVEVALGGRSALYHVYKRPFVDFFLRTVSGWYTLVIFTASMQEYADPVIDWLDAGRGILSHRLFRDSCTQLPNGSYTKDLSLVEPDLARVCLVDNSPVSYSVNQANGIPIEGWTHDPSDEALLDLLPVLDSLRFTSDVRRVLGLRTAGVSV